MSLLLRIHGAAVVPPVVIVPSQATGGSYNFLNPRKQRREQEEPRVIRVKRLGDAQPVEIITGIVNTPARRTRRKPNVETFNALARGQSMSDAARREHLKRVIAADDEWLMTD